MVSDGIGRDVEMPEGAVLLVQVAVMADGTAQVARCPACAGDAEVKAALGLGIALVQAESALVGLSDDSTPPPCGAVGA